MMKTPVMFLITLLTGLSFWSQVAAQAGTDKYAYEMGDSDEGYGLEISPALFVAPGLAPSCQCPHALLPAHRPRGTYVSLIATLEQALISPAAPWEEGNNLHTAESPHQMTAAIGMEPLFFMDHVYQALARIALGRHEAAAALIAQAVNICSEPLTHAEQILYQQMLQWQNDPHSSPAQAMADLVAAYPRTAEAYHLAGASAYWIDQDYQQAARYYQQAQALLPAYGPGYNLLGHACLQAGQVAEAKIAFETYLRLSPQAAHAYHSLGEYYQFTADYAQSAAHYEQAAALGMEPAKARAEKARAALEAVGN